MSVHPSLSRSRGKCLHVCSVCTITSYWQSVKGSLFHFGLPSESSLPFWPSDLVLGSSLDWLPQRCLFTCPLLQCTVRCSHGGGDRKDEVFVGAHLLPQNYTSIPSARSLPNPHCARLGGLTSDLPQHVWPLASNRSWSPSCSSMVPVCSCFVKLLVLCNMMQPIKIDPLEELISLWSTRPLLQLKPPLWPVTQYVLYRWKNRTKRSSKSETIAWLPPPILQKECN